MISDYRIISTYIISGLQDKDSILFGRHGGCNIYLSDISVSRIHSEIKMVGDKIVLLDKKSKFGTLVKINK